MKHKMLVFPCHNIWKLHLQTTLGFRQQRATACDSNNICLGFSGDKKGFRRVSFFFFKLFLWGFFTTITKLIFHATIQRCCQMVPHPRCTRNNEYSPEDRTLCAFPQEFREKVGEASTRQRPSFLPSRLLGYNVAVSNSDLPHCFLP